MWFSPSKSGLSGETRPLEEVEDGRGSLWLCPHVRGAGFPTGAEWPRTEQSCYQERVDLCCKGSKYHSHSVKSEETLAWDSSGLGLGLALKSLWVRLPQGSPLASGTEGSWRRHGGPSPPEGMSNKNSLQSAFTCVISLGSITLGSCVEREGGDRGIQIAAPSSWETLSGK